MKTTFIGIAICFIVVNSYAKKIEGIIKFNNDSIKNVTFNIPYSIQLQELKLQDIQLKIMYFDTSGKELELLPEQAKEVCFKFQNEEIRMVSCIVQSDKNSLFQKNKNIFLRIKSTGLLKHYRYYMTNTVIINPDYLNHLNQSNTFPLKQKCELNSITYLDILQKGSDPYFIPSNKNTNRFLKDMKEYMSDCPEVVRNVETKAYTEADITVFVKDYNDCNINN
jgi:hypothetical protein